MRLPALLIAVSALAGTPAHATPATPAQPPELFVLIVTNNRSIELGRPDLSYADDDGAKYYEVFRSVAPEAHVHLLTELDRDTARLFPALAPVIKPPTKQAVWAAVANIADEVAKAKRAGRAAELTFVYAGHGDVDNGRGFVELGDGRFTSDDLETLLTKIAATRSHVILDSCNSFFVIIARKPDGRRFATPNDAAESLSKRFPNVGVFLSTSAEAEVFEWSELQSGIFSHAVRSGLMGAADANGDGVVSYEELAAFVDTATAGIKNPTYRPKVFARGPNGRGESTLFSPGRQQADSLTFDAERQTRITIRDVDDLPWIDLFKEAGTPLVLHLPSRLENATVEVLEVTATGAQVLARHRLEVAPDTRLSLAEVAIGEPTHTARGPDDLFRMLFTRPFGPHAVAAYRVAQANEPPLVFGISREDSERMGLLLTQVGEIDRDKRIGNGAMLLGGAAFAFGVGAWALDQSGDRAAHLGGWLLIGTGAFMALGAHAKLTHPSPAELLHDHFARGLASGGDPDAVVADTERRLQDIVAEYHHTRMLMRGAGIVGVVGATGLLVLNELTRNDPEIRPTLNLRRYTYGSLALIGGLEIVTSYFEFPTERLAHLWDADPVIHHLPRLSIVPAPNGAMLGASGTF